MIASEFAIKPNVTSIAIKMMHTNATFYKVDYAFFLLSEIVAYYISN